MNRYRALTCKGCGKRRNLVWDEKKERCYDCMQKVVVCSD